MEIDRENKLLERLEREIERKQLRLLRENNRILKEGHFNTSSDLDPESGAPENSLQFSTEAEGISKY